METLAPLIAIVGCDGSGKSTLAADVLGHVRRKRAAESGYLGLGSGAIGNRIKAWPLIGPAVEAFFAKRATRARDPKDKIPGLGTAIVLYAFSLKRKARFKRVLALRRRGIAVVTDRYPQMDVPGFYDGPGLSAARAEGWLITRLANRERAIYAWMSAHVPTLVIRLHVDAKTALARKPDHNPTLIAKKVEATPHLNFNGAPIVDLDATMAYDEERVLAFEAVDRALK
jgi:hypothetical protein